MVFDKQLRDDAVDYLRERGYELQAAELYRVTETARQRQERRDQGIAILPDKLAA